MPASLPRVSGETTEVGWVTSKRYIPYLVASLAISLVLCWLFWFALYSFPMGMVAEYQVDLSQEDKIFLSTGLGIFLATVVTPLFALLWLMEEVKQAVIDRNKIRVLFGQWSWREIRKLARKRKGAA